jgi:hypothetical protein
LVLDTALGIAKITQFTPSFSTFVSWTIGNVNARFIRQRLVLDTAVGLAKILGFEAVADLQERSEGAAGVTIQVGGRSFTFAKAFHLQPRIKVIPSGTAPRFAMKSGESKTGFSAKVFDQAGADVGGSADWEATGV